MSEGATGFTGLPGLPGAPAGPHRDLAAALVGVIQAALLATMIAVPAALWSRLPPRLADHWNFAGTANGSAPRLATFLALGVIAVPGTALFAAGWLTGRRRGRPARRRAGRTAAGTAAGLTAIGVFLTAMATGSVLLVSVATRGVCVSYGVLGLRLTRIPLSRIASAVAVDLRSFSFGYRGSLLVFGSAAVILRRGPALRLTLRDGKTFVVTVDDAATAAALLGDLIAAA
jgi:hypothetical protein